MSPLLAVGVSRMSATLTRMPVSPRSARARRLDDADWLAARHHVDLWSVNRIAGHLGVHPSTVRRRLVAHGIEVQPQGVDFKISNGPWLLQKYEGKGMSASAIAMMLGCSRQTVLNALEQAGATIRSPGRPLGGTRSGDEVAVLLADPDWLRAVHHGRCVSVQEIADRLGVARSTVARRMDGLGVERFGVAQLEDRRLALAGFDESWLRTRHLKEDVSVAGLAAEVGSSPAAIRRLAARCGVELRARARQVPKLLRDPEALRDAYEEQRLTLEEIATQVGVAASTVRRWLVRHGIPVRPRGAG